PAPLPKRSVKHFALLRPQLGVLFSALVIGAVFGASRGNALSTVLSSWLLLSALSLHSLALGFTKASWDERSARFGLGMRVGLGLLAFAVLAVLVMSGLDGLPAAVRPAGGEQPLGILESVVLWPARALVEACSATSLAGLLKTLPFALLVLGLLYLWAMAASDRFEEATLEGARARTERRERFLTDGGVTRIAPPSRRRLEPCALAPGGRPDLAIVWKNLIMWSRMRLSTFGLGTLALGVVAGLAGAGLAGRLALEDSVSLALASGLAVIAMAVSYATAFATRNDLRSDLGNADVIRTWPLPPERVVRAELAAPWLLSTLVLVSGLFLAVCLRAGTLLAAPSDSGKVLATFGGFLSASLSAALFLPSLILAVLVIQNAATLAFPAWFPPGPQRRVYGVETTGIRLLAAIGTFLAIGVALVPSTLLAGPLIYAVVRWERVSLLPLAAFLAALPVYLEAFLATKVMGRLLASLDPAQDLDASSSAA
ncbi:MAG: hypothetical protein JNK60_23615, partial [Acidobacteria bacterium]|nr:hypothetical protein [Acidobacteriota bacterium]